MKYIDLPRTQKAKLRRTFGVSNVTVWSALTFSTQSDLAKKIRKMAIDCGGIIRSNGSSPDDFRPNCQTTFVQYPDSSDMLMIQKFANEIRATLDNRIQRATIYRGDVVIRVYEQPTAELWSEIVQEAQYLSELQNT